MSRTDKEFYNSGALWLMPHIEPIGIFRPSWFVPYYLRGIRFSD